MPSRELLVDLYVTQGLRQTEIAIQLGCGQTVVSEWLRAYGITIRY